MRNIFWKGAEPPARVAAIRALDFDHACPIVGQKLGTVGTSNVVRQIQQQHIVEGLGWHRLATFWRYGVLHCLPGDAYLDKRTRGHYHSLKTWSYHRSVQCNLAHILLHGPEYTEPYRVETALGRTVTTARRATAPGDVAAATAPENPAAASRRP